MSNTKKMYKQFLKPTKKKIVITTFLFVWLFIGIFSALFAVAIDSPFLYVILGIFYSLPLALIMGPLLYIWNLFANLINNAFLSINIYLITTPILGVVLGLVYCYLLSCLIMFVAGIFSPKLKREELIK